MLYRSNDKEDKMKRFRIYQQENGRLHKLHGRYFVTRPDKQNIYIAHGYDTLAECQPIIKALEEDNCQYCVIDFERHGLIVEIGMPI